MITSLEELEASVEARQEPPEELSEPLKALWYCKKGRWHAAHEVAQEIDTQLGSWIHAHLHVIEGDQWNAGYWYQKAKKPETSPEGIGEEWPVIVAAALEES